MQDITPPNNRRPAFRPPERPVTTISRPVGQRMPGAKPVSIDGMVNPGVAHKSLILKPMDTPAEVEKPHEEVASQPKQPAPEVVKPFDNRTSNAVNLATAQKLDAEPASSNIISSSENLTENIITSKKRFNFKKFGLISLALLILGATAYISVDTWFTNQQAKAVISTDITNQVTSTHTKEAEGKDESPLTPDSLASYTVSPELPRALYIDKLGVASRILPMSVNTDGSVQSPLNIFDAGWYTGSVKPGEIGASFIDGHASGAVKAGLFAYLDTLVVGDTLQVEKGDGQKLTYRVVHTETVPLEGLDMKKVLLPYSNTLKGLNLMTCTGEWVEDKATYDHRVLVYTELV